MLRRRFKGARPRAWVAWRDRRRNRRWLDGGPRILVVRHPTREPFFYDVLLEWLEHEAPDARRAFELRLLPCCVRDLTPYVLHVPWLQDPVESWSRRVYAQAWALTARCDAAGIPTVNRVDRLGNARKLETARLLASAGIRMPRMRPIADARAFRADAGGLPFPLFVRENAVHGGDAARRHGTRAARAADRGAA